MTKTKQKGARLLIPEESYCSGGDDIQVGIFKTHNPSILNLHGDKTLLSSIFLIKSNSTPTPTPTTRPVLLSFDHAARSADSDWTTAIYHKQFDTGQFEVRVIVQLAKSLHPSKYSYHLINQSINQSKTQ